jgi:uncharacterized protein YjdB
MLSFHETVHVGDIYSRTFPRAPGITAVSSDPSIVSVKVVGKTITAEAHAVGEATISGTFGRRQFSILVDVIA